MNYSAIINKAFRIFKKGSVWGFLLTVGAVSITVFLLAGAVGFVLAGGAAAFARFGSALGSSAPPSLADVRPVLLVAALVVLASLLMIPVGLIAQGGLIHIVDETMADRPATVGDAWRFGARRMGRVLLVDLAVSAIATVLLAIGIAPLVLAIVGVSRGGNVGAGVVVGICGGCLLALVAFFVLVLLGGFSELAIRYALIGERPAGDALGAGWTAFRARFGNVVVILLIMFGFGLVIGMVQGIVDQIAQFMFAGARLFSLSRQSSAAAGLGTAVATSAITFPVALAIGYVTRILQASMWTAFFRQMTGLDVPPAPASAYAYPSYPVSPQSGFATPTAPGYPPQPVGQPAAPQAPPAPTHAPGSAPEGTGEWMPPMAGPNG